MHSPLCFLGTYPSKVNDVLFRKREQVEDEIDDIAVYLLDLADILQMDLPAIIDRKLAKNAADRLGGSSGKYTEYTPEKGGGK